MVPSLPTETLTHVLSLVNAGEPPIQRQLNRQRFARDCRAWFRSVDHWSELAVVGEFGLRKAQQVLELDDGEEEDGDGLRVRSTAFVIAAGAQGRVAAVEARVPALERSELASADPRKPVKKLGHALPGKIGRAHV